MTKIPRDVVIGIQNPRNMYCLYGEWCKEECGHKYDHKENTACHNMCVVYGAITCCEVKKTWGERWVECKQSISKFGNKLIHKLGTFL